MRKFYAVLFISILFLFPFNSFAKPDRSDGNAASQNRNGFVVLKLDNSINDGKSINAAYIVLDKYDLTYAGFINQKFDVVDNKIMISDLPEGKYYADIYIKGMYKQHFKKVITVAKKVNTYTFRMDAMDTYILKKANIPSESNDFSGTGVAQMK
jgi:hypothetical protein